MRNRGRWGKTTHVRGKEEPTDMGSRRRENINFNDTQVEKGSYLNFKNKLIWNTKKRQKKRGASKIKNIINNLKD